MVLYFCYYCSRVGRLDFAALGRWELGFVCRTAAGYQAYMVGRCFWSFFFFNFHEVMLYKNRTLLAGLLLLRVLLNPKQKMRQW